MVTNGQPTCEHVAGGGGKTSSRKHGPLTRSFGSLRNFVSCTSDHIRSLKKAVVPTAPGCMSSLVSRRTRKPRVVPRNVVSCQSFKRPPRPVKSYTTIVCNDEVHFISNINLPLEIPSPILPVARPINSNILTSSNSHSSIDISFLKSLASSPYLPAIKMIIQSPSTLSYSCSSTRQQPAAEKDAAYETTPHISSFQGLLYPDRPNNPTPRAAVTGCTTDALEPAHAPTQMATTADCHLPPSFSYWSYEHLFPPLSDYNESSISIYSQSGSYVEDLDDEEIHPSEPNTGMFIDSLSYESSDTFYFSEFPSPGQAMRPTVSYRSVTSHVTRIEQYSIASFPSCVSLCTSAVYEGDVSEGAASSLLSLLTDIRSGARGHPQDKLTVTPPPFKDPPVPAMHSYKITEEDDCTTGWHKRRLMKDVAVQTQTEQNEVSKETHILLARGSPKHVGVNTLPNSASQHDRIPLEDEAKDERLIMSDDAAVPGTKLSVAERVCNNSPIQSLLDSPLRASRRNIDNAIITTSPALGTILNENGDITNLLEMSLGGSALLDSFISSCQLINTPLKRWPHLLTLGAAPGYLHSPLTAVSPVKLPRDIHPSEGDNLLSTSLEIPTLGSCSSFSQLAVEPLDCDNPLTPLPDNKVMNSIPSAPVKPLAAKDWILKRCPWLATECVSEAPPIPQEPDHKYMAPVSNKNFRPWKQSTGHLTFSSFNDTRDSLDDIEDLACIPEEDNFSETSSVF